MEGEELALLVCGGPVAVGIRVASFERSILAVSKMRVVTAFCLLSMLKGLWARRLHRAVGWAIVALMLVPSILAPVSNYRPSLA